MVIQDEPSKQSTVPEVSFKQDTLALGVIGCLYFLAHEAAFLFPDSGRVLMAVWPAGGIGLIPRLQINLQFGQIEQPDTFHGYLLNRSKVSITNLFS